MLISSAKCPAKSHVKGEHYNGCILLFLFPPVVVFPSNFSGAIGSSRVVGGFALLVGFSLLLSLRAYYVLKVNECKMGNVERGVANG